MNGYATISMLAIATLLTGGCSSHTGETESAVSVGALAPVQSDCVDANIADMAPPDLYRLIAASVATDPDAAQDPNSVRDTVNALNKKADTTPHFPWGEIPPDGLALFARGYCKFMTDDLPPDRANWAQKTSGIMFMQPLFQCDLWAGEKVPSGQRYEGLNREATTTGDKNSQVGLLILENICPQLK